MTNLKKASMLLEVQNYLDVSPAERHLTQRLNTVKGRVSDVLYQMKAANPNEYGNVGVHYFEAFLLCPACIFIACIQI